MIIEPKVTLSIMISVLENIITESVSIRIHKPEINAPASINIALPSEITSSASIRVE